MQRINDQTEISGLPWYCLKAGQYYGAPIAGVMSDDFKDSDFYVSCLAYVSVQESARQYSNHIIIIERQHTTV